jgi:hypothetical protein
LLPVVRPCSPPVLPGSEFAAKPQNSRKHVAFFSSVRPPTWHQQIPGRGGSPFPERRAQPAHGFSGGCKPVLGRRPTVHRSTSRHHNRGHQSRQLRQLSRRIKRSLAAAPGKDRSPPCYIEGGSEPASDAAYLLGSGVRGRSSQGGVSPSFVSISKASSSRSRFDTTRGDTADTVARGAQIQPLQMTTARPGHRTNRGA